MDNDIFSIAQVDSKQVVLKVHADDNFVVATHPYISREYDYITVTRGAVHNLTIIKTNGSTFSFHWGEGGYTLISENLKNLKSAVIKYIQDEQHIMLDWDDGIIDEAVIFYNDNYGKWQLTLRGDRGGHYLSAYYWSKKAKNATQMIKECNEDIFDFDYEWDYGVAVTGIDVWTARLV